MPNKDIQKDVKKLSTQKPNNNRNSNNSNPSNSSNSIENSMLFGVENWDRERLAKWFVNEEMGKFVAFVKLLDGYDLLGGDIVHLSFDCPRNLREYFNQVARRKAGSSCKLLRSFMLKTIAQHVLEKHALGNTLSDVVPSVFNVPAIVMPTYVQSRVRRYVGDVKGEVESRVEDEEDDDFVNQFGVWCVLKQSRFRDVRYLPCFYWKSCKCGNADCWERVKPLISGLRGSIDE